MKIIKYKNICMMFIAVVILVAMGKTAYAEEFKITYNNNDIISTVTYDINEDGNSVTLKFFKTTTTDLIELKIPSHVTYEDKTYVVTDLADTAFYVEDVIGAVQIPETVKTIGYKCFYDCDNLQKVTFTADGLEKIGTYAFFGCPLQSFTIPSTVKSIGSTAFGYSKLTSITIPGGVKSCGTGLFYGSQTLKEITFAEGITNLWKDAISTDSITNVNLPSTLQVIEEEAMNSYAVLDELVIPAGVTKIEKHAFYNLEVKSLTVNCKDVQLAKDALTCLSVDKLHCYYNSGFHKEYKDDEDVKITFIDNPMIMKKTKLTVGAGATAQLQLIGSGNITWTSSNTQIATVNQKGLVTTKKNGKVTIIATDSNGKQATCTITVKTNERKNLERYTKKASAYPKNIAAFGFTKIKRDSKGNYIISGHFLNNYSQTGTYLKNLTITVYKDGKKIAKQKYSKFKIKAPANSMRPVTIKIKKSKITKKTTDLRNGKIKIKVSGGTLYR